MKKLDPDAYRSMPWKNGAGTTIEIAVCPAGAAMDDFVWRVSRAAVVADGRFSLFEGIDRSLALLAGEGMRLNVNGAAYQVDQNQNIVRFGGDLPTDATLLGGPIQDFNLMSRRAVCNHELLHWTGASDYRVPASAVLVYCASGSGVMNGAVAPFSLQTDQSALIEPGDCVALQLATDPHSRFYCVLIDRLAT